MVAVLEHDLIVGLRAASRREVEAVADLHALDGLDPHERRGQARVEAPVPVNVAAQARGQAVGEDLDDSAEGVPVAVGRGARGGSSARCMSFMNAGVPSRTAASSTVGSSSDISSLAWPKLSLACSTSVWTGAGSLSRRM